MAMKHRIQDIFMIQAMAERVADYLEARKAVDEDAREVIVYGTQILVSTTLNIAAAVAAAAVFGRLPETAVFVLVFVFLRRYAGGYHADTYLTCFLSFMGVLGILFVLLALLPEEYRFRLVVLLSLLSVALVFRYAPVDHPNKPATFEEKCRYRRIARVLAAVLAAAAIGLSMVLEWTPAAFSMAYALLVTGISLPVAQIKKEVSHDEEGNAQGDGDGH
jgi:accessory gene regulator B